MDHCMVVGTGPKAPRRAHRCSAPGRFFRAAGLRRRQTYRKSPTTQRAKTLTWETEIRRLINSENGFKSFGRIADFRFISQRRFETGCGTHRHL